MYLGKICALLPCSKYVFFLGIFEITDNMKNQKGIVRVHIWDVVCDSGENVHLFIVVSQLLTSSCVHKDVAKSVLLPKIEDTHIITHHL